MLPYQQSSLYFVFSYPFTSKFKLAAKLHWVIRAASSTAPQYRHLTAAVHAAAPAPILGPRRTWFGFWRSGQTKTVLAIFSAVGSRATPRPGLAAGAGLVWILASNWSEGWRWAVHGRHARHVSILEEGGSSCPLLVKQCQTSLACQFLVHWQSGYTDNHFRLLRMDVLMCYWPV